MVRHDHTRRTGIDCASGIVGTDDALDEHRQIAYGGQPRDVVPGQVRIDERIERGPNGDPPPPADSGSVPSAVRFGAQRSAGYEKLLRTSRPGGRGLPAQIIDAGNAC